MVVSAESTGCQRATTSRDPIGAPAAPSPSTRTSRSRSRLDALGATLVRFEPWLAIVCASILLSYPNPFVLAAAVIGGLPTLARWRSTGRPWRKTAFDVPLLLVIAGALLGGYGGLSREGAALRLYGLLAALLLYAAILEHATTPRRLQRVTMTLLALVTVGTLALVLIADEFLRFDRVPLLGALIEAVRPVGEPAGSGYEAALGQRFRFYASGVGALGDVGLALWLGALLGLGRSPSRLLLLPLALVFASSVVISDNRGSMLFGALTLATLAVFWRPRLLPLIPIVALSMLSLLALGLVDRGLNLRTIGQRFSFWENSLYLARELPITGAGLGTQSVQLTYGAYFLPSYPPFSHTHNIYLQALLEQGVLGFLGLVGLVVATFWVAWRLLVAGGSDGPAGERRVRAAGFASLGGATALFSTGLSEITALTTLGGTLLLTMLGLLAAAQRTMGDRRSSTDPGPRSPTIRRSSSGFRSPRGLLITATSLLVFLVVLAASGLAARGAALVLLNLGAVELNRATLSEDTTRAMRPLLLARAIGLLRGAASLGADTAIVQRNMALALAAQDDDRGARAAANRARAATPSSDERGQMQVARAFIAAQLWPDAIRAFEAAGAGPQLVQLGNRLVRGRNREQALAAYTAAIRLEPRSRAPYAGIARMGRERGDTTEEVIARFAGLIALGGWTEHHAHLQVASVYRGAGRYDEALDAVDRAGRIAQEDAYKLERGLALAQAGRLAEAEPLLRFVTERIPDEEEAYYWLGVAQWTGGQFEAAAASAQTGLAKLPPSNRAQRGLFLALIGDSMLALGRPAEALEAYEQGTTQRPGDPHLVEGVARARAALTNPG